METESATSEHSSRDDKVFEELLEVVTNAVARLNLDWLSSWTGNHLGLWDWFVTIDLKDAYVHIEILPQHRKFLRFAFGGEAYQYWVLPFGLSLSPRTYTKCMDAALAHLCIRIFNYTGDWLNLAQSQQLELLHRAVSLAHLESRGLRLNAKKSVLSTAQRTMYLGVESILNANPNGPIPTGK